MKLITYITIFVTALIFWIIGFGESADVLSSGSWVPKNRHKRYVAFPEGSTFILTLCLFFDTVIYNPTIFYEGLNWGVAYDLPNVTTMQEAFKMYNKPALKRRQRRDLYNKLEVVLEKMGFEGRACIYRALCEANRRTKKQTSFGEDLVKLFFNYPLSKLSFMEPDDHRLYHWATRHGMEERDRECRDIFSDCSFSIVHTFLGVD